jgi:hypothetical protein
MKDNHVTAKVEPIIVFAALRLMFEEFTSVLVREVLKVFGPPKTACF